MLSAAKKRLLMKLFAFFGIFVFAAALWRAKKATDGKPGTKFSDNAKDQLKNITVVCLQLFALAYAVYLYAQGDSETANGILKAQVVGIAASGVGVNTNFNTLTYVPQFLYFEASTVPQAIKVNVNGDGLIMDLDGTGITAMSNIRSNGRPTNGFLLQLANGMIPGKNVDISFTNGLAATVTVFAINANMVEDIPAYMVTTGITVNASQSFDLNNFSYCALPSFAATDILNLYGSKRSITGMPSGKSFSTKQELETLRGLVQLTENMITAKLVLDNYDGTWQQINFTPTATQKIYVQRPIQAGKFSPSLLS